MIDKLLYTPREAAELLGISRSTLYVLLASGEIASVHIGASRRVPAAALRAYVDKLARTGEWHSAAQVDPDDGVVHRSA